MMGENPFLSDPNINKVRKALSALDFLVVQDIFLTETAEFADVILPASSYLEKDGTYTNTDRRVQLGRKVLDPPGEARVDWEIIQDIAPSAGAGLDYPSPARDLRGDGAADAGLRQPHLRQPRLVTASSTRTRIPSTATARSCSSTSGSTPTTGSPTSCRPSGCRARSCPARSSPSCSTRADCWSTGTPGR